MTNPVPSVGSRPAAAVAVATLVLSACLAHGQARIPATKPTESAAAGWRCTLLDTRFTPRVVRVTGLSETRVDYVDEATGVAAGLPLEQLIRLEGEPTSTLKSSPPKSSPRPGGDVTHLFVMRDGQRVYGLPGELNDDAIAIYPMRVMRDGGRPIAGQPLKDIEAIVAVADVPAYLARAVRPPAADELRLTNGDVLAGVVSAADKQIVTCQTADGVQVPVGWSSVRQLVLAPIAGNAASPRQRFRVFGVDGGIRDGGRLRIDAKGFFNLTGTIGGVGSSLATVAAIEQLAPGVAMLAAVAPTRQSSRPYFPTAAGGDTAAATRPPDKLTIAGYTTRSAIAARPRSVMTWALDGTHKRFVTRYGVADAQPLADVTMRVRLDDGVVHERGNVKSGSISDLVSVDLGVAKSLTLEVDFGENYDVQDHAYWVEPALLAE